ncbi:hypothetical protein RDWZM_000773 [Blomia tropicalis]|uniref:Uncharacterized protein n=1 Tax=Blomia tropicalis TaxID=40697 RepID=A0A9Q0M9I3_BLOTA|nr:hypothetical protein RDWZM_000773 [Blomia tropicalis]
MIGSILLLTTTVFGFKIPSQESSVDVTELNMPQSLWLYENHRPPTNVDDGTKLLIDMEEKSEESRLSEGLENVDNNVKHIDNKVKQSTLRFVSVGNSKVSADADDSHLLTETDNPPKETVVEKLDRLIREISEDGKREMEANQVDNSFQAAEAIKAKLDFEINRTRLILMRLRSLQRNVADAHSLAKKLVESDVASKYVKEYAINNLDKSVEKVKKILVKM